MTEQAGTGTGEAAGSGEQGQVWREQFLAGDELKGLREDPSLATIPDIPNLARSFVETKALVGRKGVILPGEKATPEEMNAFYTALGRPESADKYELPLPETIPPEIVDADLEKAWREIAFKYGLNQKTAQGIQGDYLELLLGKVQAAVGASQAAREASETELKGEWGDEFEANLRLAKKVILSFADDKMKAALDHGPGTLFPDLPPQAGDPIFNNPLLARFLVKIGKAMGEGVLVKGDTGGAASGDLQKQANALMAQDGYFDINHKDHVRLVNEVKEIYAKLNPEPKE